MTIVQKGVGRDYVLFLGDVWYYSQPSQNQMRFYISISKAECIVNMKSIFKGNLAIVESRIMENILGKKCISRKKLHTYRKNIATLIIHISKWVLIFVPSKSIFPMWEWKINCVLIISMKKSNVSGIYYPAYIREVGVRGTERGKEVPRFYHKFNAFSDFHRKTQCTLNLIKVRKSRCSLSRDDLPTIKLRDVLY